MFSKRFQGPGLLFVVVTLILAVTIWRHAATPASPQSARAPHQPAAYAAEAMAPARHQPLPSPPVADPMATAYAMHARDSEQATRVAEIGRSALQRRYQEEGVDPAWAAATERVLLTQGRGGLISQAAADPQDLRVQCRSTVCRVEASFATPSQLDDWFPLFALAAGDVMSKAGMRRSVGPDGRPHVEVYAFARRQ